MTTPKNDPKADKTIPNAPAPGKAGQPSSTKPPSLDAAERDGATMTRPAGESVDKRPA